MVVREMTRLMVVQETIRSMVLMGQLLLLEQDK
jgi:hypothetical protein